MFGCRKEDGMLESSDSIGDMGGIRRLPCLPVCGRRCRTIRGDACASRLSTVRARNLSCLRIAVRKVAAHSKQFLDFVNRKTEFACASYVHKPVNVFRYVDSVTVGLPFRRLQQVVGLLNFAHFCRRTGSLGGTANFDVRPFVDVTSLRWKDL